MTSKQKTNAVPRKVGASQYRYTVDEILSLMVVCNNGQVLLYDTCDMTEYNYSKYTMREKYVQKYTKEECPLEDIFETFVITSDDCLKHSWEYWKRLVPGADLLYAHILEPEEGYHADASEYAQTKLNTQPNCVVLMDRVPLVHALPIDGVHAWLKFVGRKFSDIPRDNENKHTPFCTVVL